MANAVNVTVASGFAVSSAFYLYPTDRRWSVSVPSMAGSAVRLDFTTTSGGNGDVSFGALHQFPLSDQSAIVMSSTVRPALGWFVPPTPYARIHSSAVTTDTASFVLVPLTAK